MSTVWYVHVNRGVIDHNTKHEKHAPAITIKKGKRGKPQYAFEVELPPGSRMIYSPQEHLLPCGARCVIVSPEAPKVIR